jgi:hypothetical protein
VQKSPKVKAVTRQSKFVTSYATWQSAIGPGRTCVSYKASQLTKILQKQSLHSNSSQTTFPFSLSIPQIKHHKNHKKFSRTFKNTLEYSSNYRNQIITINHAKNQSKLAQHYSANPRTNSRRTTHTSSRKTDPSAINHELATNLQGSQRFGANHHHRT